MLYGSVYIHNRCVFLGKMGKPRIKTVTWEKL